MKRLWFIAAALSITMGCSSPPAPATAPVANPAEEPVPLSVEGADRALESGRADLYERGLLRAAESADPAERRRALVRLGLHHASSGRHADAAAALRQAIPLYPELDGYLKLKLLEAEKAAGDYAAALRTTRDIIETGGSSQAATLAQISLPPLLARTGSMEAATAATETLLTTTIDEFSEPLLVQSAKELDDSGRADLGAKLRLSLLRRYPQGRHIESLYASLASLAANPVRALTFDQQLDLAERLGRFNRYDQALDLLAHLERVDAKKSASPAFRFVKLQSLFNSRNYEQAREMKFEAGEPYYLASEVLRARAHWRSDSNREFLTILEKLIRMHPRSDEATQARLLLGKYFITDDDQPERAAAYYRDAIEAGGAGKEGEHLWNLAWIQIAGGENEAALATMRRYIASYADHDYTSNSLFWSGKLHAQRGNTAERDESWTRLINLYPYSYYAHRARDLMGPDAPAAVLPSSAPEFPAAVYAFDPSQDDRLVAVRQLTDLGLHREAAAELKTIAAKHPDDDALAFHLAELYSEAEEPMKAMGILQRRFRNIVRHGGKNVPPRFWQILYPRRHWEPIQRAAAKRNLDPYLMTAIIRQESGFEPTVVSNAGAVGLMQIMPNEASRIASVDGQIESISRSQLFEPNVNVEVGAAEIRQKLQAMNDRLLLAIASYNAGEDAVGRWIAKTPLDDIDRFIESIPYAETRLYVKNVVRNQREYVRIYENEGAATVSALR